MPKYDLGEIVLISGQSQGYGLVISVGGNLSPIHRDSREVFLENGQVCITNVRNMRKVRKGKKYLKLENTLLESFKENYNVLYDSFIKNLRNQFHK